MKNKVLIFIIGFLVGAIIATGGFLIYEKVNGSNQFPDGNPPQMMDQNMKNRGTPPQKPEGEVNGEQMQIPNEDNLQTENQEKSKKQKNKLEEQNTNETQETNI